MTSLHSHHIVPGIFCLWLLKSRRCHSCQEMFTSHLWYLTLPANSHSSMSVSTPPSERQFILFSGPPTCPLCPVCQHFVTTSLSFCQLWHCLFLGELSTLSSNDETTESVWPCCKESTSFQKNFTCLKAETLICCALVFCALMNCYKLSVAYDGFILQFWHKCMLKWNGSKNSKPFKSVPQSIFITLMFKRAHNCCSLSALQFN